MTGQWRSTGKGLRFWQKNLALDLGTTNVSMYMPGRGLVLQEPSVVALSNGHGQVAVAGTEAHRMLGKAPSKIKVIKPLWGGRIADFEAAKKMLEQFISRVLRRFPFLRLRLIVTVPCGLTQVERRAVFSAAKRPGVKEIYFIEEPVAAAIGSGLPVTEPRGIFIINLGGGVTEIAVLSLGGIVLANTLRVGGETVDEAIQRYLYRQYHLKVGLTTAEAAKRQAGYAVEPPDDLVYCFRGINMQHRLPEAFEVKAAELTEVISPVLEIIAGSVREVFEQIPPQLASDVIQDGIYLTGGGSLLNNLDLYFHRELNLPVQRVKEPLSCAVEGASQALGYIKFLEMQRG